MSFDLLLKTSIAVGKNEITRVLTGHVNSLFIASEAVGVSDWYDSNEANLRLTVRYKTEGTEHRLIDGLTLMDLKRIDCLNRGQAFGTPSALVNAFAHVVDASLPQVEKRPLFSTRDYTEGGVNIPLGSIQLTGKDELIIELSNTSNTEKDITLIAVSDQKSVHHMVQYIDETGDDHFVFNGCDHVYSFMETITSERFGTETNEYFGTDGQGVYVPNANPNIQIKSGDVSTSIQAEDILRVQASRQSGIFNMVFPSVLIWSNKYPVPQDVEFRLTGDSADDLRFIGVKTVRVGKKVSAVNVDNLEDIKGKVAMLERSDPDEAKALRHSGVIPKSEEIQKTIDAMDRGDEK